MTQTAARLSSALSGRYTIERELGQGGMATVYLARDVRHDRPVAIKVLSPDLAAALGAERFLSEIKTTAKLQHPHILSLLDSGDADGMLYYVMPFVEGESLRARLDREKQLPLEDATRIAREVSDALGYAHQRKIVHRDIKPENILLAAGHALLADFGIAIAIDRAAGERLTGTGITLGTPAYMSPEQALGEPNVDHRSDIYSTACVLYEMLAGEVPFRAPTGQMMIARRLSEDPTPLRVLRGSVAPALERAVTRALARSPADRFQSAADFGAALAATPSQPPADSAPSAAKSVAAGSRRRSRTVLTLGVVALAAAAVWATLRPRQAAQTLDEHLIAISPFAVLDPDLALWKQGFVDILAANLDGAGAFRTVSPSVVMRRWSGRSDRQSAAKVAQSTGAGISIFGRLEPAGSDSLRGVVWIDNAKSGDRLGEVEFRESAERMDRLGDSLSIGIMRQLGLSGAAGSTRLSSLGSRSLPAIKLFLQGEQLFRRASFDSARQAYERAIAVDSSFGLAMNRLAFVLGWQSVAYDDESTRLMLTAAQFVSGLSPRDSMHLTADALWARLLMFEPDSSWWTKGQLLLSTLRDMNARSPGDFAVWNLLGEARFHLAGALGASWDDALDAFDRAIAIDSAFGPAWVHPISIALSRDSVSAARRYAQGLHDRRAREGREDWVSVVSDVLDSRLADSLALERRLATLSLEGIFEVWASTSKWFDSAETSIKVGRAFAAARPTGNTGFSDPAFRQGFFVQSLIDRGHFNEALRTRSADLEAELPYLAEMRVIPADSANAVFDRWVRDGNRSAHIALGWWAARADSAAIRRFAERARARSRRNVGDERHFAAFELRAADAYLALARRDTTRAVATLLALPDSLCPTCYAHRLTLSQLLLNTGREMLADSILRRELTALQLRSSMADFHWRLARARAAELTGNAAQAISGYEKAQRAYAAGDSTARSVSRELGQKVASLRGSAAAARTGAKGG
jgi:serine/threonine-protein kinase